MNCAPMIGRTCYLHKFLVTPKFTTNDFGGGRFLELLSSPNDFGLLSTKKLPSLAKMTFFITLGEIGVEISSVPVTVSLSEENDLVRLRNFHATLFTDVMQIRQSFLAFDYTNQENAFFIVPVTNDTIDWKTVDAFQTLPEFEQMSAEGREGMTFSEDDYMFKVVSPVYRMQQQRYIVTKIHSDKTPNSPFPNDVHSSYAEYFLEKYYKSIMNAEQFLIEVKGLTQNLNFLIPGEAEGGSKKFVSKGPELLVPELCHNYRFPGDLCLKAILLPSILNRLHYLLHADALRKKINNYLSVRVDNYKPRPVITKALRRPVLENVTGECFSSKSIVFPDPEQTPARYISNNEIVPLNDILQYPWPEVYEPISLERNQNDIYPIDLIYFSGFVNKRIRDVNEYKRKWKANGYSMRSGNLAICDATIEEKSKIQLLHIDANGPCNGPEQCDILAAITAASAGDVFDGERLELMGDSFLKFAISFYLLQKYPSWHEGFLSACKGQMVSNRNLCYLAIENKIPGIININKFNPKSDWAPPLFCLPMDVKVSKKKGGHFR